MNDVSRLGFEGVLMVGSHGSTSVIRTAAILSVEYQDSVDLCAYIFLLQFYTDPWLIFSNGVSTGSKLSYKRG